MITVYEVGPRDGLQNESAPIATRDKIAFVDRLSAAGLPSIEAAGHAAVPVISRASAPRSVSSTQAWSTSGGRSGGLPVSARLHPASASRMRAATGAIGRIELC